MVVFTSQNSVCKSLPLFGVLDWSDVNSAFDNTPGTAGCPGSRDRTLAVKSWKKRQNIGGNKFLHTEVSPKWDKSKRRREKERKKERRETESW